MSFKENNSVFKFEDIYRNMFKKSCAFRINKDKHEKIEKTDLKFVKSKKKKSYFFSHNIVGKKINKFVQKNTIVLITIL